MYVFNNIIYKEIYDSIKEKNSDMLRLLIDFALRHHYTGNIIQKYLAYMLLYNENPFSISCENNGEMLGNHKIILLDFKEFYDLFNDTYKDVLFNENILNFDIIRNEEEYYDTEVQSVVNDFCIELKKAKSVEEFYDTTISYYRQYGVGEFAFHKAFRISDEGDLIPVKNVLNVSFDDIIGYDWQKKKLIDNTNMFCKGLPSNNVLLYGDAGTGKSTSIKAVLNTFFKQGLRMIEVYKHQMNDVANLIATFKKRHYKFVIYMDDLSFEENEVEYKQLKSIIEGGLEAKPSNVLVYATSNRRHIISETTSDNLGNDLHRKETEAEKLSLSNRFGLQIFYSSLSNIEFKNMVLELAKKYNINEKEDVLLQKANQWEIRYGNLSGRTAEQFVKFISSGGEI